MSKRSNVLFSLVIALMSFFSVFNVVSAYSISTLNGVTCTGLQSRPINIKVSTYLNSNHIAPLQVAMTTWNNAGKGTFFNYGGTTATLSNSYLFINDGSNIVQPLAQGALGPIALTYSYMNMSTGKYVESDILINTSSITFSFSAPEIGYDSQSMFTHELGHSLGLGEENSLTESTMYKSMAKNETKKRSLEADDLTGLSRLY